MRNGSKIIHFNFFGSVYKGTTIEIEKKYLFFLIKNSLKKIKKQNLINVIFSIG